MSLKNERSVPAESCVVSGPATTVLPSAEVKVIPSVVTLLFSVDATVVAVLAVPGLSIVSMSGLP